MTDQIDTTEVAGQGHNRSPFDDISDEVASLYEEAQHWLDGQPVETEEQAENVEKLLSMLRDAEKRREAAFKEEKQPHLDKCREIDGKWKPLKEQLKRAVDGCRSVLTPFREAQERKRREEEERKRQEAEAKQKAAKEAMEKSDPSNIVEREKAEAELQEAKEAEKEANKINRQPKGLRTTYRAEITDPTEFAKHCWTHHYHDLLEWMQGVADKEVRTRKKDLPGVKCHVENVAN